MLMSETRCGYLAPTLTVFCPASERDERGKRLEVASYTT
jgi:hypothetical protein